jgi:tetrahydromethanopterin S-methyltransferase subunit B
MNEHNNIQIDVIHEQIGELKEKLDETLNVLTTLGGIFVGAGGVYLISSSLKAAATVPIIGAVLHLLSDLRRNRRRILK